MPTISSVIIKDHRELKVYYNEVVKSIGYNDHQQRCGNQFTWELARHSVGEELVLYPALEKYLGEKGKQMAESDRKKHHEAKEMLKIFQNMSATDPDYVSKLNELWSALEEHIKEEEQRDLPALEEKLQAYQGESESIAKSFGDYSTLFGNIAKFCTRNWGV